MRTDLLEKYTLSLPETARREYCPHARHFLEWLRDREPDAEAVRAWLDRLKKRGYSDGTVALEFAIIRRLFRVNNLPWSFRQGESPVVREMEVYAPALAQEDIAAMVDVVLSRVPHQGPIAPAPKHRAFLCLSTVWGLRRVEMASMRPEMLDAKGHLVFVETAKHGRQRWHVVPPNLEPHLQEWGFRESLSEQKLSYLFTELKWMIGFTGSQSHEVGWHSIRRAAVSAAYEVGIPENMIYSFFRWKRSSTNMPMRYGTGRIVGRAGEGQKVMVDDRKIDELFYEKHPFPAMWR